FRGQGGCVLPGFAAHAVVAEAAREFALGAIAPILMSLISWCLGLNCLIKATAKLRLKIKQYL
ncbi:hypothetical protein, partial [Pseudomonas savastanoi]|uniref:hypothetical protein n=1 Tax=Pseudomonas savastanoi TaxID=29438 RepID=UPI001CB7A58A